MAFRKNNFEATPLSGAKRIESKEKKLLSSSSKYLEHKDNKNKNKLYLV